MAEPLASVVIVNWNGLDHLRPCLDSLHQNGQALELIVVDNGSTDGSIDYLRRQPDVVLIANQTNTGYAPANNAGIARATCEYVLLLNNDTRVAPGFLDPLLAVMDRHADVAGCQCKVLTYDNPPRIDAYGSYLTGSGFLYHLKYGKPDVPASAPFEIFAAKGAALLLRAAALRDAGVFDADFFAYLEDSDLSWRLWLAGWRIFCVPASVVFHRGGVTASRLPLSLVTFHSFKNRIAMLLKNLSAPAAWRIVPVHLCLTVAVLAGELARGRPAAARGIAAALLSTIRNSRTLMAKRRDVQSRIRRVSDRELLPRLKRSVRLSYYYYLFVDLRRYRD